MFKFVLTQTQVGWVVEITYPDGKRQVEVLSDLDYAFSYLEQVNVDDSEVM